MKTKICSLCKKELPLENFDKGNCKYDLDCRCKECKKELHKKRYSEKRSEILKKNREYLKNNPEVNKKANDKWREKNPEYNSRWYEIHKEDKLQKNKEWALNNPDKIAAKSAKRRARELRALPEWADLEKIKEFYKEAKRLTEETGIKHEVDHIVPLQGKVVSGLHIETNLQVISKKENQKKSNKFKTMI